MLCGDFKKSKKIWQKSIELIITPLQQVYKYFVIANVVWRFVGKEIASTTPQMWLVAGSHLGFAKKSFHSIASDKRRAASFLASDKKLATSCHRERSVAICWQGDCRAVYSTRLAMTRTASKNHEQVQKDWHGNFTFRRRKKSFKRCK